ncbi:MAG: dTDP-4-dehydrorhamnose 3,5-epimerase family protein [Gammaproteobacteria bacterium]|nr:dTDP-4-dehydrorhamnose 3,5-epimerase family protein [Gammaproteobacteria bacterium]
MDIIASYIEGVVTVKSPPVEDDRGSLRRLFCQKELTPVISERQVVQINHTVTNNKGAVRGLHFQYPPHAEMKIVRCIKGKVWDVAVDLRQGSATFLQWFAQELTPENGKMMVIPEGCAHGFQVLENESELLYLHTAFYNPDAEGGVNVLDPKLAVDWPMEIQDLSDRDRQHPLLSDDFTGVVL